METIEKIKENECTLKILCCECGTAINPNPSNMCIGCLRTHVDITEGITKQVSLYFCKGCERYLQPPAEWIHCALESRELLSLCLKKLKGLQKVKLIDASFVWTEPHSKRIKLKLTVQDEVIGGAILQQVFIVEYMVNHQMCNDCHRTEAKDYWRASVQVRQKSENKKTFYYLEQLILKHKIHENALGIKPIHEGIDFYYATEAHARKMVDFLNSVLPCRYQHSKKLISHDIHSNIYNYKFTYSVEIIPLSKDSVVCLPKKFAQQCGGISQICLVHRVTSALQLIDPASSQITEINSKLFWRNHFGSICDPKQLVEYIVMDIQPIMDKNRNKFPGQGFISNRHILADTWVVRASDLGIEENFIHARTHLGAILKPGDSVLGYNLKDSNINDENFDKMDINYLPDVILVKKYYDRSVQRRKRMWKLKHLNAEDIVLTTNSNDYNEFLDDLEEDPELRQNVNIFRDKTKIIPVDADDGDPTVPTITLEEMLDDLVIDDVEMNE
ncbi:60S ribosomal export protein NMD3 [Agrilus planipennis]|uniref:60S ribosomal export protein NMD3 n=1 Tax=Agrilus planipennis TaxID=224129 RepID=A0A1W4WGM1_AGRPL|nr:60S ribosomal export protein NMD3 [Agrilus planipennis]